VAAQTLQTHPFLLPGGFFFWESCGKASARDLSSNRQHLEVLLAGTEQGRGIIGMVNGISPKPVAEGHSAE